MSVRRGLAADHRVRELPRAHRLPECGDRAAGAHDGHRIGYALHFRQAVRDEEHRVASGGVAADDVEEHLDLVGSRGFGRLVEDEDAGPVVGKTHERRHERHEPNLSGGQRAEPSS